MGRASEMQIRDALKATKLEGGGFADLMAAFEVGQPVLAIYEDDGEWYDATVEAVRESDGWIEVSFDEYDDGETYVVPPENVEARADDGGDDDDGRGGRGRRGAPRGAAVPPPAIANPFGAQRAALPIAAHRAEFLGALERSQAVVLEGETGSRQVDPGAAVCARARRRAWAAVQHHCDAAAPDLGARRRRTRRRRARRDAGRHRGLLDPAGEQELGGDGAALLHDGHPDAPAGGGPGARWRHPSLRG